MSRWSLGGIRYKNGSGISVCWTEEAADQDLLTGREGGRERGKEGRSGAIKDIVPHTILFFYCLHSFLPFPCPFVPLLSPLPPCLITSSAFCLFFSSSFSFSLPFNTTPLSSLTPPPYSAFFLLAILLLHLLLLLLLPFLLFFLLPLLLLFRFLICSSFFLLFVLIFYFLLLLTSTP